MTPLDPRTAEERLHEDDSYGACVICREWVPHTDETYVLVPWPCAVERLRALAVEPVPVPEVDAAWEALVTDLTWGKAGIILTIARHRPIIEAAIRKSPSIDAERCPHCDHPNAEHRTPGSECIHAHCSCDQSWEIVRALATPPEPEQG